MNFDVIKDKVDGVMLRCSYGGNSWKLGRVYSISDIENNALGVVCYIDYGVWNAGILTTTDASVSINIIGKWK